jgi:hypothetical protein
MRGGGGDEPADTRIQNPVRQTGSFPTPAGPVSYLTRVRNRNPESETQETQSKEDSMNRYEGYRTFAGPIVTVNGDPLDFRLDLHNHCPEFDWSSNSQSAAQLALAILAEEIGSDEVALEFHQRFKWEVVVRLPWRRWILTTDEITQALETIRKRELPGAWA